jgi:hypothetical protein
MAKKKKTTKRSRRKETTARRKKKPVRSTRRAAARRVRQTAARKKRAVKKPLRKKTRSPVTQRARGPAGSPLPVRSTTRGLGAEAGGQSGDTEGLSRAELADSESVEELLEEGQAFEAGIVSGVENAPDADKGGVRTRQVPEDDVPQEYLDKD